MNSEHFTYVPTQESPTSGRVLLRDGSTAELRLARPEDQPLLRRFFDELSAEARFRRFFTASMPTDAMLAELCDNSRPDERQTLLVCRLRRGEPHLLATASYFVRDDRSAEVAFVVEDDSRGLGLGTLLLERLALLAIRNGLNRLWAVTQFDNDIMRRVFRDSGFEVREATRHGEIEIDLSLTPTGNTIARLGMRDKLATVASLRPFFQPRGVAVVGASRNPDNIGHKVLRALIDAKFTGELYPINPKADRLFDRPCYAKLSDVPGPIDLAVLAVPPMAILATIDDAAAKGVRALVVITAGFAEVQGPDGGDLQRTLVEKVRGAGMRMIGPNCLGILNTENGLNASFSPVYPPTGRIAMSSQSGALGLAVLAAAQRLNLGLSTFVSVGNKADISGNDLLQYWEDDPRTSVILLYLESFGNPRRFAHIARRVSRMKPIIAIKAGRAGAGARAAGSHTAALASKDVAVDALFRQTGVLRAETLEEMFDLASGLAHQQLPAGNRVAILTNAGGPGILCADMSEAAGLSLPVLSAATQEGLRAFLPVTANVSNPVDMVASARPEQYRRSLELLLADPDIDAVIVIYIPVGFGETSMFLDAIREGLATARAAGCQKTVLGCWMDEHERSGESHAIEQIPAYAFPEAPARVLGRMVEYSRWKSRPAAFVPEYDNLAIEGARDLCRRILAQHGPGWLTLPECFELLRSFGLPVARHGLARTADEAVAVAESIGYPVVLKLSPRQLVHKTELGGVQLNLADASAVRSAFDVMQRAWEKALPGQPLDGILVQSMLRGGVEVMMGVTLDPQFGPLLAYGLGGVTVEAFGDVAFRIAPLTVADARELLDKPKGAALLKGFRGSPPADLDALKDVLLRLGRLAGEIPELRELDLNPILAFPKGEGCALVDARVRIDFPA